MDSWREEGEAPILAGGPYRRLIRQPRPLAIRVSVLLCAQRAGSVVLVFAGHLVTTPSSREAGEIPAQSRYGERPFGGVSPVADPTVHARTFERKVGRTVNPTG